MIKLALPFRRFNKLNDVADEFNIKFIPDKSNYSKLLEFLDEYPDKRVNVCFDGQVDTGVVKSVTRTFDNVYFRISEVNASQAPQLKELGAKYFFDAKAASAYNKVSLMLLLDSGVSDVYLADDMWYNLYEVSKACHDRDVNVRCVVDVIQSTSMKAGNDPRVPFVRPEDYEYLDGLVDVYEFSREGDAQEDVLYRTYMQDKSWNGYLGELNQYVTLNIHNKTLVPEYSTNKYSCGMRCAFGGTCEKCQKLIKLAEKFYEKNLKIVDIDT